MSSEPHGLTEAAPRQGGFFDSGHLKDAGYVAAETGLSPVQGHIQER